MFDLSKASPRVEGEVNSRDSAIEMRPQIQAHSATSAAPKMLVIPRSSTNSRMFDPSHLAHLLLMLQDLPNHHPGGTSAFSETPATAWRGSNSAVPKHSAIGTTAAGDGARAVRDAISMPLKHGQVVKLWSRIGAGGGLPANQSPVSQCQTTMDIDGHQVSDGESDSCKPVNSRNNSYSKVPVVDLDALPNEIPVEPQFARRPGHQQKALLHSTLLRMSSENPHDSATELPPMSVEQERRVREIAFNACFNLQTQRCTPTARCRTCLAFCQTGLPSLQEGFGPGGGLQSPEKRPPNTDTIDIDDEEWWARPMTRHGPKSRSSRYLGVTFYKRTERWEAHVWHDKGQVNLGASRTEEEAARVHDQAALLLLGPRVQLNFKPESYKMEMAYLYKLSKQQLVLYLRRDSRGFGAQVSYPGVKLVKGFYEAEYMDRLLGKFEVEEDAARAVYKKAVRHSEEKLVTAILDTHHVRNMPSYAAQRFAALHPGARLHTPRRNHVKPTSSKRPRAPEKTSSPQKKRLTSQATKQNRDSTSRAAASAVAAPHPGAVERLRGKKVNENIEVSPGALTTTPTWDGHLVPKTSRHHADCINPMAPQRRQSRPHQPSNAINTLTPQQMASMLPKRVRAPAATTAASSSCHAPSVPSIPQASGEASSSGVVKFKLFNVEISVEPGHGGDWAEAHGESEP